MIQFLISALFAFNAQASDLIQNSTMDLRHQKLIIQSLQQSCGYFKDIVEIKTTVTKQQVDQGITDYFFNSIFHFTVRVDNGVFDQYKAQIQSSYHSSYDHQSGQWGLYSVGLVNCILI